MPRFSANLGFLWPDRPLLSKIDAAARAGFKAVELHFPYDVPASEVKAACARWGSLVRVPYGEPFRTRETILEESLGTLRVTTF